jgi:hypothetical protein
MCQQLEKEHDETLSMLTQHLQPISIRMKNLESFEDRNTKGMTKALRAQLSDM